MLLLGCDMPLINEALVRTILDWDDHAPAVVPVGPQGPEPLCALYRSTCAPEVERRLHSRDRSLCGLAKAVGAVFIDEDAVARIADAQTMFLNVNTVRERDRAEDLLDPRGPRVQANP